MQLRPLIIMISAGALVASSFAAHSNTLRDSFDYYKRNPSGTYTTSSMRGYVGPSFSARNNQVNPRLLTTVMPSWSAGCGGIDFFAGSFAIVTKDELVQMGRGIAQGAPGYFFNLAMAAVCPTCQQQMAELQAKLEKFNALTQNTCEQVWNSDLANHYMDKAKADSTKIGVLLDVAIGHIPDPSTFIADQFKKFTPNMAEAIEVNTTVQATTNLIATEPAGIFTDITPAALYVSLFGTKIAKKSGELGDENKPEFDFVPPTIDFQKMLYNTATQTIDVMVCEDIVADPDCKTMNKQPRTFEGLVVKNTRLINSSDPADLGIIPAFTRGVSLPSEEARMFQRNTKLPWETMISDYKDNPNIYDTMAQFWALEIARAQLTEFYQGHRKAFNALTLDGAELPPLLLKDDIIQAIKVADEQLQRVLKPIDDEIASITRLYQVQANLKLLLQN